MKNFILGKSFLFELEGKPGMLSAHLQQQAVVKHMTLLKE